MNGRGSMLLLIIRCSLHMFFSSRIFQVFFIFITVSIFFVFFLFNIKAINRYLNLVQ